MTVTHRGEGWQLVTLLLLANVVVVSVVVGHRLLLLLLQVVVARTGGRVWVILVMVMMCWRWQLAPCRGGCGERRHGHRVRRRRAVVVVVVVMVAMTVVQRGVVAPLVAAHRCRSPTQGAS